MKKLLSIALLLVSTCLYAQDSTLLKRVPYKLTVAVDKNNFYEEDIKATPYVLPDRTIQVYPGETVYVEVEQENGIIKSMTAVKEIKNPSKTITIAFTQTAKKKVHELMMLKIANPFSLNLTYKANIYVLQRKAWFNTNVLPVMAGLSGFESWPQVITSIAVGDWAFQSN
jgi:hypothetical protein